MRTRVKNFLDIEKHKVMHSFQFLNPETGNYAYPAHADRTVMVWPTAAKRDAARAVFTGRKRLHVAFDDLKSRKLIPKPTPTPERKNNGS